MEIKPAEEIKTYEDLADDRDYMEHLFNKKAKEGDGNFAIAYALMVIAGWHGQIAMEAEGIANSISGKYMREFMLEYVKANQTPQGHA